MSGASSASDTTMTTAASAATAIRFSANSPAKRANGVVCAPNPPEGARFFAASAPSLFIAVSRCRPPPSLGCPGTARRCSRLALPQPRVEPHVDEVDGEVDHDEDERDEHEIRDHH